MSLLQTAKDLLGGRIRAEVNERAVDELLDSLDELLSEVIGPRGRGGASLDAAPFLPAKGQDEANPKVVKLSDAILAMQLFYGYALRKVFAQEFAQRQRQLHDAMKQFAGKQVMKRFLRMGIAKTFGAITNLVMTLVRVTDKISYQKAIARRIRFHGRASRLEIIDAMLFGNNRRVRDEVRSRHGWGKPPRRTTKDGDRDQRSIRTR